MSGHRDGVWPTRQIAHCLACESEQVAAVGIAVDIPTGVNICVVLASFTLHQRRGLIKLELHPHIFTGGISISSMRQTQITHPSQQVDP